MSRCLLVNSAAAAGRQIGVEALRRNDPLLDVVESILRAAENDTAERSLGLGGRPNLLGVVELDASLMDGSTRHTGSVGALTGFLHPVSVARQVMERLPHEFLVGEGAARFAREIGAEAGDLLTPESREEWEAWLAQHFHGTPEELTRAAAPRDGIPLSDLVWKAVGPVTHRDTAIVLVSDGTNLASGTSTSGWPFKYPGRLGDSAVIGGGHYADSRYGAAACTHTGEMATRAGTARSIVHSLRLGRSPEEACREAIEDVRTLREGLLSDLVVHALDRAGRHCALSTGVAASYWWWTAGIEEPEYREPAVV